MNAKELELKLKGILASEGYTLTALVKQLNEKGNTTTIQNISNKLKRGSLNYLEVIEILEAVNYKVEWFKNNI